MKKTILLFVVIVLLFGSTACSKGAGSKTTDGYDGKVTSLSKQFLSKGYAVNIYRSSNPLSEGTASFGKANINMTFGILTDYVSTAKHNSTADYNIKKVIVTNVKVLSTSKMGVAEDLYIMKKYSQSIEDPLIKVVNSKTKYEIINDTPNTSGVQSQVMVNLNNIALYDETKSPAAADGGQPTLKDIYDELGITSKEVTLKIGFRVELITVSDKTLYKEYQVVVPPTGVDIAGSEFHFDFYETDTKKMEPFFEKN